MSTGLTISPNNMSVYDNQGVLKFSTERIYPVILHHGSTSRPGGFVELDAINNHMIGQTAGQTWVFDRVLARRGTHYQGHPEFITVNLVGSAVGANISNTVTGSYIATALVGCLRRMNSNHSTQHEATVRLGNVVLTTYHYFINGNGDVIERVKYDMGDALTANHSSNWPATTAGTNLMKARMVFMSRSGIWDRYRIPYNISRIDYIVGRFTG